MEQPTVFIIDDDVAVRDSIQELVESVGLRAQGYASGQAYLESFRPECSGCLVLDVRMAGMSGLVLQEKLAELGARIPVIIITGHGDVPMAVRALQAGAADFIQKPYRNQLLLDSINKALAADVAVRCAIDGSESFDQHLTMLTPREREVLNKLLEGGTSKHIARDLGISPRTVEAHRQHVLHKLEVGSIRELMLLQLARHRGE